MLREILTYKWLIGSTIFLIFIAFVFVIWQRHDLGYFRKKHGISEMSVDQKLPKKTKPSVGRKQIAGTSNEDITPTVNKSTTNSSEMVIQEESTQMSNGDESLLETAVNTENVPVSPFGFGPYPKLPLGWKDVWHTVTSAEDELALRVWIRLLEQGYAVEGVGYIPPDRLLVPTIKGTLYVTTDSDGYITYSSGHPDDHATINAIRQKKFQTLLNSDQKMPLSDLDEIEPLLMKIDEIPEYIKVIDTKNAIDPYKFLGLTKE